MLNDFIQLLISEYIQNIEKIAIATENEQKSLKKIALPIFNFNKKIQNLHEIFDDFQRSLNSLAINITVNNQFLQDNLNPLTKLINYAISFDDDTDKIKSYYERIKPKLDALYSSPCDQRKIQEFITIFNESSDVLRDQELVYFASLKNEIVSLDNFRKFFSELEISIESPSINPMGGKNISPLIRSLSLANISNGETLSISDANPKKLQPRTLILSYLINFEQSFNQWLTGNFSEYSNLCHCIVGINKLLKDFSTTDSLLSYYSQTGFLTLLTAFSKKMNSYRQQSNYPPNNERYIFEQCYINWAKSKNLPYLHEESLINKLPFFKSEGAEINKFAEIIQKIDLPKETIKSIIAKFNGIVLASTPNRQNLEELISYCIFVINFYFSHRHIENITKINSIYPVIAVLAKYGEKLITLASNNNNLLLKNTTLTAITEIENSLVQHSILQSLLMSKQVEVAAVHFRNALVKKGIDVEWCRAITAKNFPFVAIKIKDANPLIIKMMFQPETLTNSTDVLEKLQRTAVDINPLSPCFSVRSFKTEGGVYHLNISHFYENHERLFKGIHQQSPQQKLKIVSTLLEHLKYLYDHGVLFVDLKLDNLLFNELPDGRLEIKIGDYKGLYNHNNNFSPIPNDTPALQITPEYCDNYDPKKPLDLILHQQRLLGNLLYELCVGTPELDISNNQIKYDFNHAIFNDKLYGQQLKSTIQELLKPTKIKSTLPELFNYTEDRIIKILSWQQPNQQSQKDHNWDFLNNNFKD